MRCVRGCRAARPESRSVLEKSGFAVHVAADGLHAMEVLEHLPDTSLAALRRSARGA